MSEAVVGYDFHVVDVRDDEAAVRVRAQLARAAGVAGITNLFIEGRPDKGRNLSGCYFLEVTSWGTREQVTAFNAALTAEGLQPVKRVGDRWVAVEG